MSRILDFSTLVAKLANALVYQTNKAPQLFPGSSPGEGIQISKPPVVKLANTLVFQTNKAHTLFPGSSPGRGISTSYPRGEIGKRSGLGNQRSICFFRVRVPTRVFCITFSLTCDLENRYNFNRHCFNIKNYYLILQGVNYVKHSNLA